MSPGSTNRTVTMTVTDVVWSKGSRVLGWVGGSGGDGDGRRFFNVHSRVDVNHYDHGHIRRDPGFLSIPVT